MVYGLFHLRKRVGGEEGERGRGGGERGRGGGGKRGERGRGGGREEGGEGEEGVGGREGEIKQKVLLIPHYTSPWL